MSQERPDANQGARDDDHTDRRTLLQSIGVLTGLAAGTGSVSAAGPPSNERDDDAEDREPTYEPTWESLDQHDVPDWYRDGKLGIFLHWGAYSVTGKLEWYVQFLLRGDEDIVEFHEENYGAVDEYPYRDFLRETDEARNPTITENFTAAEWDPDHWASFFDDAGARYVVLSAEHCDGIPLWDPEAKSHNWNTVTMGPERDLVADLGDAVRERGLNWGVSEHSMLNWYEPEVAPFELYGHPAYEPDGPQATYVREWRAKIYELLAHSKPDLLWLDGDWTASAETWGTKEIVADYYNAANEEWDTDVLVNDRLGQPYPHDQGKGDYMTLETTLAHYEPPEEIFAETYEAVGNLNPNSWGYDREATPETVPDAEELVHQLVGTVSTNGNFLIGLGPKADGVIPDVQKEPVLGMGRWLETNGEAIYGTYHWVKAIDEVSSVEVRYTAKDNAVYAIALEWPGETLRLDVPEYVDMEPGFKVEILGASNGDHYLDWHVEGEELVVDMPDDRPRGEHASHTYAVRVQIAKPNESAFENGRPAAEEAKIVRSRERMRAIVERPDLAMTDVSVGLVDEETRSISTLVTNRGFRPTDSAAVRIDNTTTGTTVATTEIPVLNPNESMTATVDWDISDLETGQAYELEAVVDFEDDVEEIEEDNNAARTTYRLLDPLPEGLETYSATEAEFGTWNDNLVISANGEDIWDEVDEYGALYRSDTGIEDSTDMTVKVESQERTDDWAKAGLMIRNDVTGAGESPGYALIAVTPENGFDAEWDTDGDGYIDDSENVGKTAYPCWLRLERDGNTFTSYYSTGGQSWTEVGSRELPDVADVQDGSLFVTSHASDERSTVEFDSFRVELE